MTGKVFYGSVVGMILTTFTLAPALYAERREEFRVRPLAVRLVLTKINPMLVKKEYSRAVETLLAFQARGGEMPEPGRPDPKGYHHPEIYFALGNCHLLQDQFAAAAAAYGRAVARDPSHCFAWLNMAKACYEMNQYAKAAQCFSRGYETAEQKNPEHLYFSAAAFLMAGNHHRSIEIFERLFASHPIAVKPEWKENLVHALLAADQPMRALPHIRELARIYTGDKKIQWQEILLYQYIQLEMPAEALNLALMLTRETPTTAKWWKALTHIRLNAGQYEEALGALTIYSYLTPLSLEEKKLLADLNLQVQVPIKAAPVYETCLEEKKDKQTLQRLVLAYRQLGLPDKALALVNSFGPPPKDPDLMILKGELLYELKQYDKAAEAFHQAARNKARKTGHAWLMAGYACWQMNDYSASRQAFRKAVQYKREKKAAAMALKQLKNRVMQ